MAKPLKEIRVEIYEVIERIAGRKITPDEHDELKKLIMYYGNGQQQLIIQHENALQRQGKKITAIARILHKKGQDAEMLEKDILFLKEIFND